MYLVTKVIHFSYGHRLQDYDGKCARLHGHNGRVEIEVSSEKLNHQEMVMDFYEIQKTLGTWIDENIDHRCILQDSDPLVGALESVGETPVLMKHSPTAEAIARLIYEAATKLRLPVYKVTLWETDNCCAAYHG